MERVVTGFTSQVHGLKFANHFELVNLSRFSLPLIHTRPISLGRIVYGLCGGMCFTALDYYTAGRPIPEIADVKTISLKLFLYLWRRQLNSMRIGMLFKTFSWMFSSDQSLAEEVLRVEIPRLRRKLDAGQPAVLTLIRVKGISNPTRNHQVAATSYELDADTNQMTIYLYDPNHPCEVPTLSLDLSHAEQGIGLRQSSGEALRGFFVIDYKPHVPPMLSL